jgi:rSAM/selenodomain-associated transferase 1
MMAGAPAGISYPLLDPSQRNPAFASKCALAVMAKAPRPGKVKTRLSPPLTSEQAAALNICFLRDTTRSIAEVAATGDAYGLVCYTPVSDEGLFDGLLPESFALIAQRGNEFGERLLAAADDILACGFAAVCLIGSDSPTAPTGAYRQAVAELGRPGDRIVLGGSNDGGYYLIGLKKPHPQPFAEIRWSTSTVYEETTAAIARAKIELAELPIWYDVDDGETLKLLQDELLHGAQPPFAQAHGYPAPSSREFLVELAGVSR